jgi:hypothetical protein
MVKVGPQCKVEKQIHVILRLTFKGMVDMKSQEF